MFWALSGGRNTGMKFDDIRRRKVVEAYKNRCVKNDLIGQRFGRLLVLKRVINVCRSKRRPRGYVAYECLCDCGNIKIIQARNLRRKNGGTKSCGCLRGERVAESIKRNIKNQIFGRLTALYPTEERRYGLIVWKCICTCGNICYIPAAHLHKEPNKGIKSCGCLRREMSSKYIKENRMGENHPNWNPELTDYARQYKRKTPEDTAWGKAVKERDNYTCQITGKCGGRLVSHHLNNYAENKDLRYVVGNGVTILEELHREFHKKYGYKGVNRDQFEEFKIEYKNKE